MSTSRLAAYLSLEREMLALDAAGDPLAERLRDAMDPIWYSLADDEHARLNARTVLDVSGPGVALPLDGGLFSRPPASVLLTKVGPLEFTDWRIAA
jgi:hypothetical protein